MLKEYFIQVIKRVNGSETVLEVEYPFEGAPIPENPSGSVAFADITGDPTDNTALADALDNAGGGVPFVVTTTNTGVVNFAVNDCNKEHWVVNTNGSTAEMHLPPGEDCIVGETYLYVTLSSDFGGLFVTDGPDEMALFSSFDQAQYIGQEYGIRQYARAYIKYVDDGLWLIDSNGLFAI